MFFFVRRLSLAFFFQKKWKYRQCSVNFTWKKTKYVLSDRSKFPHHLIVGHWLQKLGRRNIFIISFEILFPWLELRNQISSQEILTGLCCSSWTFNTEPKNWIRQTGSSIYNFGSKSFEWYLLEYKNKMFLEVLDFFKVGRKISQASRFLTFFSVIFSLKLTVE